MIGTLIVSGAVVYFLGTLTWYGAISRLSFSWTTAAGGAGRAGVVGVFCGRTFGRAGRDASGRRDCDGRGRVSSVWCWAAIRRVPRRRKLRLSRFRLLRVPDRRSVKISARMYAAPSSRIDSDRRLVFSLACGESLPAEKIAKNPF